MNRQRAHRYLDELISFGGVPQTRGEVIAAMQREGHDPLCIDRWLQGYEHAQCQQERRHAIRLRLYVPTGTAD